MILVRHVKVLLLFYQTIKLLSESEIARWKKLFWTTKPINVHGKGVASDSSGATWRTISWVVWKGKVWLGQALISHHSRLLIFACAQNVHCILSVSNYIDLEDFVLGWKLPNVKRRYRLLDYSIIWKKSMAGLVISRDKMVHRNQLNSRLNFQLKCTLVRQWKYLCAGFGVKTMTGMEVIVNASLSFLWWPTGPAMCIGNHLLLRQKPWWMMSHSGVR